MRCSQFIVLVISCLISDSLLNDNRVQRCPTTEAGWKRRNDKIKCNTTLAYHCLPVDRISLGEFCMQVTVLVASNGCPFVNTTKPDSLQFYPCPTELKGCPRGQFYFSAELFKYPKCLTDNFTDSFNRQNNGSPNRVHHTSFEQKSGRKISFLSFISNSERVFTTLTTALYTTGFVEDNNSAYVIKSNFTTGTEGATDPLQIFVIAIMLAFAYVTCSLLCFIKIHVEGLVEKVIQHHQIHYKVALVLALMAVCLFAKACQIGLCKSGRTEISNSIATTVQDDEENSIYDVIESDDL